MKVVYKYVLLLFLLIACENRKAAFQQVTDVRIDEHYSPEVMLSRLIEIDTVIAIKPGRFRDFANVIHGIWLNNRYLVLHTEFPKTISLLDRLGNIVAQVLPDFQLKQITSVSAYEDKIFILDRASMRLFQYSQTLALENVYSIPVFAQSVRVVGNEKMWLYVGNEITEHNKGKLIGYNYRRNRILNDWLPVSEKQRRYFHFLTPYHFPADSRSTYFWDSSINNLFAIEGDALHPVYRLNYGKWALPDDFYETSEFSNAYEFVQTLRQQPYAFRHFNIMMNDEVLVMQFEKSGDFLTTIHHRTSGSTLTFSDIRDDIITGNALGDIKLHFFINLYGRNAFLAVIPAEWLEYINWQENESGGGLRKNANHLIMGRFKAGF